MNQQAHCTYCELSLNCRRCGKPVTRNVPRGSLLTVAQAEEQAIVAAIEWAGSIAEAAKILGVSEPTVYSKVRRIGKVNSYIKKYVARKQKHSLGAL